MLMSSNKEYIWLNEDTVKFIFYLLEKTDLTPFTGKFIKRKNNNKIEYNLETFIYENNNKNNFCNQKIFLENQNLFIDFLNKIRTYFWGRGWKHGNLSPCKYVFYDDEKLKFKIFDFRHIKRYNKSLNTIGYLKFLWNNEIKLLYYFYTNGMELNIKDYVWNINRKIYRDDFSRDLCILLNSNDDIKIDINKLLDIIIYHLKCSVFCNNVLQNTL